MARQSRSITRVDLRFESPHRRCPRCAAVVAQALREVHAASLRAAERLAEHAGPDKQKTSRVGAQEVFTDPRQGLADGMVARDQCDTDAG